MLPVRCDSEVPFEPDGASDFQAGAVSYRGPERRSESRAPANAEALVRVVSPVISERFQVEILNISRHGLKMRCLHELQPGTIVHLQKQRNFMFGEIRYCLKAGEAFEAGVRVDDLY